MTATSGAVGTAPSCQRLGSKRPFRMNGRDWLDILKLFMSVECLRGFVFAQLLRAMKEVWHLSTHQFFPADGQWPKDRDDAHRL